MYRVHLDKFEGPLDLLAQLIETNKLEITEISLAQVADQFLVYLKNKPAAGLEELADFLTVAGRLVLIKSRSLLPYLEITAEEEGDIQNLKDQLAEYQRYRELAKAMRTLDKAPAVGYSRGYLKNIEPVFYFPPKLKTAALAAALENLLQTITLPQQIPQARAIDIISLEQKLAEVEQVLKNSTELKFSQLLKSEQAEEKVVTFLSVLELVKQNRVVTSQKYSFGEITLLRNTKPYESTKDLATMIS